jgi:CheY-like chemotaxis protein
MAQVLIVDDNPQIREVLAECVRLAGHDVSVADNGKTALEHLSAHPVDVMILDMIMPEKDGLEVIMELLGQQNRCRVIAISGGAAGISQDYILQMSKLMKVDAVLSKPFEIEILNATLSEVLSR